MRSRGEVDTWFVRLAMSKKKKMSVMLGHCEKKWRCIRARVRIPLKKMCMHRGPTVRVGILTCPAVGREEQSRLWPVDGPKKISVADRSRDETARVGRGRMVC